MIDLPDLAALADTDAAVEDSRIAAGEPWVTTEIAGLQFYRYARADEVLGEVRPQAGDRLHVIRNPDNRSDPNACEVWWRNEHMLGHLPRGVARKVAPFMDAGQALRAYVFHPGDGQAWSLSALLVGGAAQPFYERWIEHVVDRAQFEQESVERAKANIGRDHGALFVRELTDRRVDRLLQAANTFMRLPFETALPPVGKTVEIGVVARALDVSRSTVFRLARKAGAAPVVHYAGWYAASAAVEVTPALHDALRAWCAAPHKRVTRDAVSAAVRNAKDSHYRVYDDDPPF